MSAWPFITIFISFILILFFRRIDKRTINFNKYKKYSQKLSSDFNEFLKQKKEEFSNSIIDLDIAIKKANQVLTKIELSNENLKSKYENVEKEKIGLESLKKEMERLRGLRDEIKKDIDSVEKNLPSMKRLSRRVQKIGIEIKENEKALRNTSTLIPLLEKRVEDKTKAAIDSVTEKILDEAKRNFTPLVNEYWDSLELMRSTHKEEIERFRRDAQAVMGVINKKIEDLNISIEKSRESLSLIEGEKLFSIEDRISELNESIEGAKEEIRNIGRETTRSFLKQAEDGYKNYIKLLEKDQLEHKSNIFQRIEDKSKDLSSYIAKLEGRVLNLLKDIKLETDKYAETLNLKAKANESEVDLLKNRIISEINEEANRSLIQIKPLVSEMNEKLLVYKRDFNRIIEDVRDEFSSKKRMVDTDISSFRDEISSYRNTFIGELANNVQEAKSQLDDINSRLEDEIRDSTGEVSDKFKEKLKSYAENISVLEGRIGDLENIASAGQKLIEDRINTVFLNYKPEIEEKMSSMKGETEKEISKERGKILGKIDELIKTTERELSERENVVKALIEGMDKAINQSEQNLKENKSSMLEDINSVKLEARDELVMELENLKKIFRDEKERVIASYDKRLVNLKSSMKEIDNRVDGIHKVINGRIKDAMDKALENIKSVETNYLNNEDQQIEKSKNNLSVLKDEINLIKENIENHKQEVLGDINITLRDFKGEFEKELKDHSNRLQDKKKEIFEYLNSITENTMGSITKSKDEAEAIFKDFEENVGSAQVKVDNRIKDIEKRIAEFEKESSIIKKASRFKDKVKQDIESFSDLIYQLKGDKKDIMSLKKIIQNLKRDEGDISAKVRQLKGDKKMVSDIAKNAEKAIGLITVVEDKIKFIEEERDTVEKLEDQIKAFQERFKGLEAKADKLTGKENDIDVSIEAVTKTKDFITNLEKRTEILRGSFNEIKDMEEDLKDRVSIVDEKTRSLMGNERKIGDVLERFKEMDSLVIDIETRTKQLQNAREWLANSESRLKNLLGDADRLAKKLEASIENKGIYPLSGEGKGQKKLPREKENKVKTVLTLFDQKWTIPEICKVTKLSRGEVELILELNNR